MSNPLPYLKSHRNKLNVFEMQVMYVEFEYFTYVERPNDYSLLKPGHTENTTCNV